MKKLATLLLAAGLVFGAATGASAIDFKAKGQWLMSFDYGDNSNFMKETARGGRNRAGYGNNGSITQSRDNFSAAQRVRLQLDAVASEALSGTVYFEIGDQVWGNAGQGGALGADQRVVEVKRAYLDWIVPNTDLKVRMGLQGIALPAMATGASQILDDDVAAIALSNKFNDNVSLTAIWARPYNDNSTGYRNVQDGYMDNVDLFALLLPLSFDGVKVTPWAMVGAIGPNQVNSGIAGVASGNAWNRVANGMTPAAAALPWSGNTRFNQYGTAFWAGLTGEVTMWDPFRVAWDFNYGSVDYAKSAFNRAGWFGTLLAEYKLDWGTPGLYAWYSSGDDSNVKNGSERMPTLDANGTNQYSNYALTGNPYIGRDGVLGTTQIGTWGIGARLKDMSFLEDLKHTFRINYFGGTNSPKMAKYITDKWNTAGGRAVFNPVTDFNQNQGLYMVEGDSALEFGLTNTYKIYDNLTFMLDAAYVALWLDQSRAVWGNGWGQPGFSEKDAWNVNATFAYDF